MRGSFSFSLPQSQNTSLKKRNLLLAHRNVQEIGYRVLRTLSRPRLALEASMSSIRDENSRGELGLRSLTTLPV